MATEQTKKIITKLNDRLNENADAINSITPLIDPVKDDIDNFTPALTAFDNQIISIVSEIHSKQAQIISIASTAQYVVGCGTTTISQLNQDIAQVNTWNISNEGYTGNQPYGNITSNTLTSSTTGIGSFNVYTNNGGTSLGTYYSLTGPGYGTSLNGITPITPTASDNSTCTACKNSISTLEAEIGTLRSEISSLINTVNTLKEERTEYVVRRYSLEKGVERMQADNTRINGVLSILTDPTNDAII
jgi:archaellum component FlaC